MGPIFVAEHLPPNRMIGGIKVISVEGIVAAQQRGNVVLKNLVEIELVGQRESLAQTRSDGMLCVQYPYVVPDIMPIPGVEHVSITALCRPIEEPAANHFSIFGPQRPASDGMMQEHHSLSGR